MRFVVRWVLWKEREEILNSFWIVFFVLGFVKGDVRVEKLFEFDFLGVVFVLFFCLGNDWMKNWNSVVFEFWRCLVDLKFFFWEILWKSWNNTSTKQVIGFGEFISMQWTQLPSVFFVVICYFESLLDTMNLWWYLFRLSWVGLLLFSMGEIP